MHTHTHTHPSTKTHECGKEAQKQHMQANKIQKLKFIIAKAL